MSPHLRRKTLYGLFASAGLMVTGLGGIYASWEQLPYLFLRQYRACPATEPPVGVVFTGGKERIAEALRLLDKGQLKAIYISGNDFRFYMLDGQDKNRISVDPRAVNTKQNAQDTAEWLHQLAPQPCMVTLITSAAHMPRASYLLAQALRKRKPPIAFKPHMVKDALSGPAGTIVEMIKMIYTLSGIEERGKNAYPPRQGQILTLGQN